MFGHVVIFGKAKAEISVVPYQSNTLTYNGADQSPVLNGFDANAMVISGTTSATNAGEYSMIVTPKDGFVWADGTTAAKTVKWTIGRASLTVPSQSGGLTYTGSAQSPTLSGYDSAKMTLGGDTSKTNAGTYAATVTPKPNYQWSDGTTSAKTVSWTIGAAAGSLSLSATSLTLNNLNHEGIDLL